MQKKFSTSDKKHYKLKDSVIALENIEMLLIIFVI